MSVLRSYRFGLAFGKSEIPEKVVGLFFDLLDDPSKKVSYASEIIYAGMEGRIALDSPFSLDGYEAAIRMNERLDKNDRLKKEIALDYSNRDDSIEYGGGLLLTENYVSANAATKMEDAFEQILLEDELQYAIDAIKKLQPAFLYKEKVDIISCIRNALLGVTESIEKLKSICNTYGVVSEQIQVILGSGKSFEELFPSAC